MRALTIAATGMSAQVKNIEVIANNVANINTTGFKRARAEFTDLIYQSERLMGVASRGRDAAVTNLVRFSAINTPLLPPATTSRSPSASRSATRTCIPPPIRLP